MVIAALLTIVLAGQQAGPNLVENPDFYQGRQGWSDIWCREPGQGSANFATDPDGSPSLEITYKGTQDWAVEQPKRLAVPAGEILRIGVLAKCEADGNGGVSVVARSTSGDALNWALGAVHTTGHHGWQRLVRRFVTPQGTSTVQFRFEGYGQGRYSFRAADLEELGNISQFRGSGWPDRQLSSRDLSLTIGTSGAIATDYRRNGSAYESVAPDAVLKRLAAKSDGLHAEYWDVANDVDREVTYSFDHGGSELEVTAEGSLTQGFEEPLGLPGAIRTHRGEWLVIPMNEGIMCPVEDPDFPTFELVAYGGHGICMPWYGVMDPKTGAGIMTIIETQDDAAIRLERPPGSTLQIQPVWQASRGCLRYPRRLRLVPIPSGGYVAMARRYREYAQEHGLVVTLAEKRNRVPAVDRLVGAINVWTWSGKKVELCREMKSMGMDRVLWSGGGSAQEIRTINALGFLSSRYDIYQDVWDPKIALPWMNTQGWPDDLVMLPDGSWMKGWAHPDKQPDGSIHWIQGGVISSPRGLERAKKMIPEELSKIPYLCRFIDTTTASPWREDYNPAHPLTRSDDRKFKMALLEFCSKDEGLVVGSETGVDASVPYLDYYEGMESLGPFRLPDAGTDMMAYRKPTAEFLKYQVGSFYRLPLWELVYHDCTVAQWYWGDASNKAPEVWDKRDLFNILYGTAPLVMFDDERWSQQKGRILKTYKDVCEWVRKIGYDRMLSHEFLTPDHTVQRTRWSSGHWCVVNFGDHDATVDGQVVPAMGFRLHG